MRRIHSSIFQIGSTINKYGRERGIGWASHGMMRVDARVMKRLFGQPVRKICEVRDHEKPILLLSY